VAPGRRPHAASSASRTHQHRRSRRRRRTRPSSWVRRPRSANLGPSLDGAVRRTGAWAAPVTAAMRWTRARGSGIVRLAAPSSVSMPGWSVRRCA
jgi:hypothetical protein